MSRFDGSAVEAGDWEVSVFGDCVGADSAFDTAVFYLLGEDAGCVAADVDDVAAGTVFFEIDCMVDVL